MSEFTQSHNIVKSKDVFSYAKRKGGLPCIVAHYPNKAIGVCVYFPDGWSVERYGSRVGQPSKFKRIDGDLLQSHHAHNCQVSRISSFVGVYTGDVADMKEAIELCRE